MTFSSKIHHIKYKKNLSTGTEKIKYTDANKTKTSITAYTTKKCIKQLQYRIRYFLSQT